jgi:ribonuclease Z
MQLTLLGTGTPIPDPARCGPAQVVQVGDEAILIDAGSGVVRRLVEAGVRPDAIRCILITHHHSDHTIDLAHLLFTGWTMHWWRTPPPVYGPAGTTEFVQRLFHAFERDIAFRVQTELQGWDELAPHCRDIDDGWRCESRDWRVSAFTVDHEPVAPALGYRIDAGNRALVISGDTRPCENLVRHARGADLLVHEVYWKEGALARRAQVSDPVRLAAMKNIDGYHTDSDAVGRIAADADVRALALSHILFRGGTPDDLLADVRGHYRGAATVGADLMQFDVGN